MFVAEQALFAPTHVEVPVSQQTPVLHALPEQHGWVAPPHPTQVPIEHTLPEPHALPDVQHGWFAPPHVTHVPDEQTVLDAEHELPPQQA